jgi:hypothetical protein
MTDQPTTRAQARDLATTTPNRWIPRPEVRRWIFRIVIAGGPIVVFYGLMTADEVALWIGLGGTVLGTPAASLAEANVPRE